MKQEEWKVIERCPKCEISNLGRIRNAKSQRLYKISPRISRGCTYACITVWCEKKRIFLTVAQEVYKAFGEKKVTRNVYYKDKNPMNCAIDNLYVSMTTQDKVSEETQKRYLQEAKHCILHYLKQVNVYGCDKDNIIGETLLLGWIYLPHYEKKKAIYPSYSFYKYLTHYVRVAIAKELKNNRLLREAISVDITRSGF